MNARLIHRVPAFWRLTNTWMRMIAVIGTMQLTPNAAPASDGVVLLHGLCRSPASMAKIESALVASGYIVANVGYDSRAHSIRDLSDQTVGDAMASARLRECATIHFVTHSMGGILVRDYFSRHPAERLGRVVMLAPPNRGSEVVDRIGGWFLFRKINGPAGSELGTDRQSTPNRLGPVGFECGVIAGDRSINWINSTMIPGRDDGKVSVDRTRVDGMSDHMVVHTTHPFIMKNSTAIASTLRFIQTGQFRPGSGGPGKPVQPTDIPPSRLE